MEARPLLRHVRRVRRNGWDQRGDDIQVPGCAEVSAWYWGSYCVSFLQFFAHGFPFTFFLFLSFLVRGWGSGGYITEDEERRLMNA